MKRLKGKDQRRQDRKGKKMIGERAVASLFLFLTSCSQSVHQILLLQQTASHTHTLTSLACTNPPLPTLTLTKYTRILPALLTHIHTHFILTGNHD